MLVLKDGRLAIFVVVVGVVVLAVVVRVHIGRKDGRVLFPLVISFPDKVFNRMEKSGRQSDITMEQQSRR